MPKKTVVFYTLQTCGAGSSLRILRTLNRNELILREVGEEKVAKGRDFVFDWSEIPAEGQLVRINCHYHLSPIDNFNGQKFIVNFRDPRDRLCNEYMWNMSHPFYANEPKEDIEARAANLRAIGVDAWLRERVGKALTDQDYYQYMIRNADRIPAHDRLVNTYARLCLDFDSYVDRTAAWLDVELTPDLRQALEKERTDNLEGNPAWSGHHLAGADLAPGRYKYELEPESIAFLSKFYAPVLRAMARLDPDYASLYLEHVDDEWGRESFPATLSFFGQDHADRSAASVAPAPPPTPASPAPIAGKAPLQQTIYRHMIVDRPDLRIDHLRSDLRNDKLVFTFTRRNNRDLAQLGFGAAFLLENGFDVVAIKTSRDIWYENLVDGDIAEIERWLSWGRTPYRLRLGYGSSMGAYGAVRFSKALKLDRVLALSPIFDIKQAWDTRWKADVAQMSPDIGMIAMPGADQADVTKHQLSDLTEYMMIFDPLDTDGLHIARFKRLIAPDKLTLMGLPYAGHPSGHYLLQLDLLADVTLSALGEGRFPEITAVRRRRKGESTTYLFNLAGHCLRRGHLRWALDINTRLRALQDHPAYHMQACRIWEALGRIEEAVAAIDRALTRPDDAFHQNYVRYKEGLLARQTVTA